MAKVHRPRRGSHAFYPKKRAKRIYPAVSTYPESEKVKIPLFAGYKVGMVHVVAIDTKKSSLTSGQEIVIPVTVLDCPPLKVVGLRVYKNTVKGFTTLGESWIKDLPKELERNKKVGKTEDTLNEIEKNLEKISKVRLIVSTQPKLSGIGKKKPEIFEIEITGKNVKDNFDFAKQNLGKDLSVKDVMKEGELADVIAVTKGKGMAGVVKRFGIRIQDRHAMKKKRHIGTLGQQAPGKVRWTVPMAGQLGFQTRTEINKRVLKIGEGKEINSKSGFKRYGVIKSNYLLLEGSIPGSKKRLVMLRTAIRPSKFKMLVPEIKEIVS
ncbi:50S ribosomal protein L3 [archaeon]|nr:50S ribosomal protein L3 [archaeon]